MITLMILTINIESKTIGAKELFRNLRLVVEPSQKIALIGRNGVGKTTLFNILTGHDKDYQGSFHLKRGTRLISTAQEHHDVDGQTVLQYVLFNLPEYSQLKNIIDTYPDKMGDNLKKIEIYSNALQRFSDLGYYHIEEKIIHSLASYQINETMAHSPMAQLSGGQKRFVELVRIKHADADIVLVDEPTNHMDYIAKIAFIDWLRSSKQAVLVITHDRDVLQEVDEVVEMKDGGVYLFKGNYKAYLRQNVVNTSARLHDYQVALKTMETLHKKILWAKTRKPLWHGTADQRNPFEVMERRLQKEYDEIKAANPRPNFWIDRQSAENLTKQVGDNYEKFKSKNIRIHQTTTDKQSSELLVIEDLILGYTGQALFKPLSFKLQSGERLHLIGRNGTGKTTLVRAITKASKKESKETLLGGTLTCNNKLHLSIYEQELKPELLSLTLVEAIERIYQQSGLNVSDEIMKRIMSNYLFDPHQDGKLLVKQLSGGQKARLQIIRMLSNNPNLLILDEPTNHLDLPSIEALENALSDYHGAVLYITHDSHFAKNVGGEQLLLTPDIEN